MKFTADHPHAGPEKAAERILEIANSVEAVQGGRIHIEKISGPFLFVEKATPAEYKAGLDLWRLPVAGWSCTRAARSSGSRRPARIFLPEISSGR